MRRTTWRSAVGSESGGTTSLGGIWSSVANFLFYQKNFQGRWQKLRVIRTGSMVLVCRKNEFDGGIYFGADSLVTP